MGLPIGTAIFGLVAGLSVITLLGHGVQVPTTAPALATMIGLGVGIDYGLFVVTRHKEQIDDGHGVPGVDRAQHRHLGRRRRVRGRRR